MSRYHAQRIKKIYLALTGVATFVSGMAVIRSYMSGEKYTGKEEIYGKTCVVTGANRGIGKETAKELAKRGAKVILACRDMKLCEEVRKEIVDETFNKNVHCMKCDLSSLKSIKEFADQFNKNEKFLNVLVNNAAVMWAGKGKTKEGIETHLGINHMGHFYLTNLLLPKLEFSGPGSRVINLTCHDHLKGKINFEDLNSNNDYDDEKAYNQSKLATILFTAELSERTKSKGITANCVDPGYVYTDLMRNASVYRSPYSPISLVFKMFLKTPKMGAQPVIFAAVCPDLDNQTGKYIHNFKVKDLASDKFNKEMAVRMWLTSERWTRLSGDQIH